MKAWKLFALCAALCLLLALPSAAVGGYEASLSTSASDCKLGDELTVSVDLSDGAGGSFAAAELNILYDSAGLRLDSIEPEPRGITGGSGTLRIADYGEDKALGEGCYTLHFTAIGQGAAEVGLISASLGTIENAVDENLKAATIAQGTVLLTVGETREPTPSPTPTAAPSPSPSPSDEPVPTSSPAPDGKNANGTNAKTGDEAAPMLWFAIDLLCGAMLLLYVKRKKNTLAD